MIDTVTQNLKDIIAQIDEAEGMARCLANEFFGPQPEKESSPEISGGSIISAIKHLESRVQALLHQLNRFHQVPQPPIEAQGSNRRNYWPNVETAIADLVSKETRRNQ